MEHSTRFATIFLRSILALHLHNFLRCSYARTGTVMVPLERTEAAGGPLDTPAVLWDVPALLIRNFRLEDVRRAVFAFRDACPALGMSRSSGKARIVGSSCGLALPLLFGRNQLQPWKIRPVAPRVASQQGETVDRCVGSDIEIR
jgi:hypothetical protein